MRFLGVDKVGAHSLERRAVERVNHRVELIVFSCADILIHFSLSSNTLLSVSSRIGGGLRSIFVCRFLDLPLHTERRQRELCVRYGELEARA